MTTNQKFLEFQPKVLSDAALQRLPPLAGRIGQLLSSNPQPKRSLQACLDDLLGAVYSLMYAKQYEYDDRPQPLAQADISNVVVRAKDMAALKLRTEGKWTAGFYFNNALFRTSGVYHRALKILTGNELEEKGLGVLRPLAEKLYEQKKESPWENDHVRRLHKEVNDLKHTSDGIIEGRDVPFATATEALEELLNLIEALK
jgi:hypothetical protein